MDASLNEYVPLESLMKTLCKQNKQHLEEIEKLQNHNSQLQKELSEAQKELNEFYVIYNATKDSPPETILEKALRKQIKETEYVQHLLSTINSIEKKYAKLQTDYYNMRRQQFTQDWEARRALMQSAHRLTCTTEEPENKPEKRSIFDIFKKK